MLHRLIYFFLAFNFCCSAQKYNFVNFTVEDGLIQSQAMHIVQDKNRYLWIATEGGLSQFDGKNFIKYSSQEGLPSNFVNRLLCDKKGRIWIGTRKGLSVFDGRGFRTLKYNTASTGNTSYIAEWNDGIWFIAGYRLHKLRNNLTERLTISSDTSERVTFLRTEGKHLMAYVFRKGLYVNKEKEGWKPLYLAAHEYQDLVVRDVCAEGGDTLIGTSRGLFVLSRGALLPFRLKDQSAVTQVVFCVTRLHNSIWIGTDQGAFRLENGSQLHFNARNGLTDNYVYSIFRDAENNLWFASDADGIFKFKENNFSFYDKSFGLVNPIIMGVAQMSDGDIFAADYGGNLYRIGEDYTISPLKTGKDVQGKINTVYADKYDNLYIGTLGKRIYRYHPRRGLRVIGESAEHKLRGANCFLRDSRDNLIIGNSQGLFVLDEARGSIRKIPINFSGFNALALMSDGRVIGGSSGGVFILDTAYTVSYPKVPGLENSDVLCLKYLKGIVWLGTTEHGVCRWDMRRGTSRMFDAGQGLPSNFIYSLIIRNDHDVWLGTGFGISNLLIDRKGALIRVKNYGKSDGLIGMECNHTSELLAADSTLWFGTTKGLAHFRPSGSPFEEIKPFVHLRSVKLFSSPVTDSALCTGFTDWFNIPLGLDLAHHQNHLSFELAGIYLSNPEDLVFRYKLEGIDKDYTVSGNPVINYPALPPGTYTLLVQAMTRGGIESANSVQYSFRIRKAYYQELWFQLLLVLFIASAAALTIYWYLRKKQEEKLMRERIREEEFTKLRQRTAEDFHDEMGNKLTRISILSDILKSKLSSAEKETLNIVNQIRENTTALYHGSRDIIWSLSSKNDLLFEIAEHIGHLGREIFSETAVAFRFSHTIGKDDTLKMKLDHSRNLIMIFKEVYNNILKHSQASAVEVRFERAAEQEVLILISDNGRGFDPEKQQSGNGLKNIRNRVNRINGQIRISSSAANGTEIIITLKDIFYS